jgi:hypothetical protein
VLDLLVVDDAALLGVDEEHAARLQAALARRCCSRGWASTPASEAMIDDVVLGHVVARRAQAVAVERGADHACRR